MKSASSRISASSSTTSPRTATRSSFPVRPSLHSRVCRVLQFLRSTWVLSRTTVLRSRPATATLSTRISHSLSRVTWASTITLSSNTMRHSSLIPMHTATGQKAIVSDRLSVISSIGIPLVTVTSPHRKKSTTTILTSSLHQESVTSSTRMSTVTVRLTTRTMLLSAILLPSLVSTTVSHSV